MVVVSLKGTFWALTSTELWHIEGSTTTSPPLNSKAHANAPSWWSLYMTLHMFIACHLHRKAPFHREAFSLCAAYVCACNKRKCKTILKRSMLPKPSDYITSNFNWKLIPCAPFVWRCATLGWVVDGENLPILISGILFGIIVNDSCVCVLPLSTI